MWVDFYDKKGALLKSYKAPLPFPVDSAPTSDEILIKAGQKIVKNPHWGLLPLENYFWLGKTLVSINGHFYSMAKDRQRSWLAIFKSNGDVTKIIEIFGESIQEFTLSTNLKTLVYTSYPSAYQREMGNNRKMVAQLFDIASGNKKEIGIEIVPQKARTFATLKISADCRKFLVINGANLYLGDIERGEKICDWKAPDGSLIKSAFVSPNGNCVLCELVDYRWYLLDTKGSVMHEGKSNGNIIDVHFDEYSHFFDVLEGKNFRRYKW